MQEKNSAIHELLHSSEWVIFGTNFNSGEIIIVMCNNTSGEWPWYT